MINYGQEDKTNAAYGSMSRSMHRLDMDDTNKGGRWMDTPDMRGSGYGFDSSFGSDRRHGHDHYHPYRRSKMGYFPKISRRPNLLHSMES